MWYGMRARARTYPDIERLEAVARRCAERHQLRACVRHANLEVAVRVLLLQDHADRLLDVDQESARACALLVVRHSPLSTHPVVVEGGALRVVSMGEGLCGRISERSTVQVAVSCGAIDSKIELAASRTRLTHLMYAHRTQD